MLEDKLHSYTLKLKTAFPSHSHIIHPFSSATSNNIRSDRWCVSTWEISSRRSGAGNGGRREWTKSTALSSKCTSKPTPESSGSIEVPRGSNHYTKVRLLFGYDICFVASYIVLKISPSSLPRTLIFRPNVSNHSLYIFRVGQHAPPGNGNNCGAHATSQFGLQKRQHAFRRIYQRLQ